MELSWTYTVRSRKECTFDAVVLIEVDLRITIIAVERREDLSLTERISALIHYMDGVGIPYGHCIQSTVYPYNTGIQYPFSTEPPLAVIFGANATGDAHSVFDGSINPTSIIFSISLRSCYHCFGPAWYGFWWIGFDPGSNWIRCWISLIVPSVPSYIAAKREIIAISLGLSSVNFSRRLIVSFQYFGSSIVFSLVSEIWLSNYRCSQTLTLQTWLNSVWFTNWTTWPFMSIGTATLILSRM